jgi:hypothetical protein
MVTLNLRDSKLLQVSEYGPGSGVDVKITIFGDICQYSRKYWRFSQNQWYDQIFAQFSSVLIQKRLFFRQCFWRKSFKKS